ncbi:NlpC/p60-like transpeptidase-domain-containing protein [Aspergillus pseudodeflectus]|uniref:NlpC/p60-like transpeptidase-domain-containing protein n=1 Tax=Aspergillus pseudodeflectus TaxID=176178 RepID=A0ABR4L4U3_9EURO
MTMLSYTGSGPYCYAHSLYMILQALAPDPRSIPSSGFIECLTTMPFGKLFINLDTGPVSFFSNPCTDPDAGLRMAIETLGWECTEHRGGDAESALSALRAALTDGGPVLAGPLNMGHLTYYPGHTELNGADHFVVVMGIDDKHGTILLHDPAGYPAVHIPKGNFIDAWHAEGVEYNEQPFVFRSHFRHVKDVPRTEMIARTVGILAGQIRNHVMVVPGSVSGVAALERTREAVQNSVLTVLNELAPFTFPLAARRYLDARDFLVEAGLVDAAEIMEKQAALAGKAQYPAMQGNWEEVCMILEGFIELEAQLVNSLKRLES